MDAAYFGRIEAIDWTMEHDDGLHPHEWEEADLVLVGGGGWAVDARVRARRAANREAATVE